MSRLTGLLPGGYVDARGTLHRSVEITALSGREEELLAGNGDGEGCALVTTILSRCVRRLGNIAPAPEAVIRSLPVADRSYLLLKLRDLTFGPHVQATLICPDPACGHKVDIDFSTGDIPIKESEAKGPFYVMQLSPEAAFSSESGQAYRDVTFRLPNGGDQEQLSPLLMENEAAASSLLLKRCLQSIGPLQPLDDGHIAALSPLARMEIERHMAQAAPQVALTMEGDCPQCGRTFALPFDLQRFFLAELRTGRDLLYREVHYLAFHYHWSEQEIMGMPRAKRRKYIEILADEIESLNDARRQPIL